MKFPVTDIYQAMLDAVDKNDYNNIKTSLNFLEPIFASIKDNFNKDIKVEIKKAVDEKQNANIKHNICRLIFYNMKDIFNIIRHKELKDSDLLKAWLKISYMNYILLFQSMDNKNKEMDLKINNSFKLAYEALGKKSPYIEKVKIEWDKLFFKIDEIEKYCSEAFSDLDEGVK